MCFSWGLQNSATNVHLVCILGFQFESKTTPFSVKEFYSGIFVFALICIESKIRSREAFLLWYAMALCLSFLAFGSLLTFKYRATDGFIKL